MGLAKRGPIRWAISDGLVMYESSEQFEPTVAGAAWQYRWLVLFLSIGFAGLAYLLAGSSEAWTAEASIAVEDPRASTLFAGGNDASPERYVRSQAEIISSRAVASRAVELAAEADPPVDVTVDYILGSGLSVGSSSDSDLITVAFTDETQYNAITVANAIVGAYQQVGRDTATTEFDAAILELDSSIAAKTSDLLEAQDDLRRLVASDATRLALDVQLDSALSRLLLFDSSAEDATIEELNANAAKLAEIRLEIETLQVALAREDASLEIQSLIDRQNDIRERLVDLQLVRDQNDVDAQLSRSGVVFFDPAATAVDSGAGVLVLGGFMFGAALGSAIAFLLSRGRRRFASRGEPESALGFSLVADIPNFLDERLATDLPVVEAPSSASSEAFRFVSTAIALQRDRKVSSDSESTFASIVLTSPTISAGKTTVAANTAFAAALSGNRVLLVDADFSNQALTTMLIGSVAPRLGLADVIGGGAKLGDAVVSVSMEGAGSVDLLASGGTDVAASDLLSSSNASAVFRDLSSDYDLVIIDGPPLLTVAYSTTLVRLADRALVVLAHGQDVGSAQDLRHQLDTIGTPVLGYVYNFAPLRVEMTSSSGLASDWRRGTVDNPGTNSENA